MNPSVRRFLAHASLVGFVMTSALAFVLFVTVVR